LNIITHRPKGFAALSLRRFRRADPSASSPAAAATAAAAVPLASHLSSPSHAETEIDDCAITITITDRAYTFTAFMQVGPHLLLTRIIFASHA
jgi:hypothetical protein